MTGTLWDGAPHKEDPSKSHPEPASGQHQRPGPEEQSTRVTFPPLELRLGADDLMTRSMDPDIAALEINAAAEGLL